MAVSMASSTAAHVSNAVDAFPVNAAPASASTASIAASAHTVATAPTAPNLYGVATISELMALIFPQEPELANECARLFAKEKIGLDTIGYVAISQLSFLIARSVSHFLQRIGGCQFQRGRDFRWSESQNQEMVGKAKTLLC